MKLYILYLMALASVLAIASSVRAQTTKYVAVPLRFEFPASGRGIIIKWPQDPAFVSASLRRRILAQDFAFKDMAANTSSRIVTVLSDTSAIDTSYRAGTLAEYEITLNAAYNGGPFRRSGVMAVCRNCQPEGVQGKMILVVEKMVRDSLPQELAELQQDLKADGWLVRTVHVSQNDLVPAIKDSIFQIYQRDNRVKMVYLLGHVPIPYSGNISPDGHGTHQGAWSADGYYVTFNMNYTDQSVNNQNADRPENKNIPGDGKFDQGSVSELQPPLGIARVSLHNLPVFTQANPAFTEPYITRRYLQKAHLYKIGGYTTNGAGIVDDNFNYFNGEAFATAGWMGMNACLGPERIKDHPYDLLFDSRTRNWLMGYGCGGGGYEACLDVGNSRNFAGEYVNVVFMQLFGSYFGDWDSQDNLMRSALGGLGGVLTCSWSGRPWHHYHLMGANRPYGETARINMFNPNSGLRYNRSPLSVSIGFMGDPSLRLRYFKPPTGPHARQTGNTSLELRWNASQDTVSGYHVYRATGSDTAGYERITQAPVRDTVFQDAVLPGHTYFYMVKGVQIQGYPGGTYINTSLGAFTGPVSVITGNAARAVASLNLYPNPTQGRVKVESNQQIQAVQVLDGLGLMVQMHEIDSRTVDLDLSALSKGVYTLKVQSGGVWQVKRVVRW